MNNILNYQIVFMGGFLGQYFCFENQLQLFCILPLKPHTLNSITGNKSGIMKR